MTTDTSLNLVAALMEQSMADTQYATNNVIEAWRNRALDAEARLELVRREIRDLLAGRWAPSASALEGALWPTSEEVASMRIWIEARSK